MDVKDKETKKQILEGLKSSEGIMRSVTLNTNEANIIWLSHLRHSIGILRDSIRELNKEIEKDDKQKA